MNKPVEGPIEAGATSYAERMAQERERIKGRHGLGPDDAHRPWGVSLSGGGIRSATFCLGVLQALSRARAPETVPLAYGSGTAGPDGAPAPAPETSLLGQVDYLSTVSGGGYVGTFFASLFVPGRAIPLIQSSAGAAGTPAPAPTLADEAASAANAYDTLRHEPDRLRAATIHAASGAQRAMRWLRENGRYLAPSSAGDLLYGAATVMRAWCGLHLVLGLALLVALAVLNLVKNALLYGANQAEWTKFIVTLQKPGEWLAHVSLSGLWMFPALVLLAWALPCGCAYWITYPPAGRDLNHEARQSALYWLGYLGCALLLGIAAWLAVRLARGWSPDGWGPAATPFALVLAEMLAGALWFLAARGERSFAGLRVCLTRQLTRALKLIGVLAFLALVDTLARTLYQNDHTVAAPLTTAGVLAWLVRRLAPRLKGLQDSKKSRVPVEVLLTIGAAALALLVVTVWDYGVIWLQAQGVAPALRQAYAAPDVLWSQSVCLFLLLLAALPLTVMMGRYPQFLNLSSLQNLYSARLTRAYQGASNAARFGGSDGDREKFLSSAEPLGSDHILHAAYNLNRFAPLHIINVCLNQNVDPAEQLVQRDRKGRPLAILPSTAPGREDALPFAIDGWFSRARGDDTLTIGEWIGVSGAAAATGSGRRTSPALALLLGLANVRLGRWWRSGAHVPPAGRFDTLLRTWLPTQAYLADELSAHFYGNRRPLHYLSDGGHFENTGIYELLREDRGIELVVACDCGADPGYLFDDLANLIRLARIDFGVEIEVDPAVTNSLSQLRHVFGTAEELARPEPGSNKCAMLLNVFRTATSRRANAPDMRIVLIKPVLIAGAPLDVHNYGAANPDFPQQTTGDQFFDEAQWESYRKLGFESAMRIFDSPDPVHRAQLWSILPRSRTRRASVDLA